MEWLHQHGRCREVLCRCTRSKLRCHQINEYINDVSIQVLYLIICFIQVSGSSVDLEDDLSTELDIVGRINPDTVWDYITKMKKTSNKDIVILRLQTANDEEKMQYIALYSYLSSRNRLVFCMHVCEINDPSLSYLPTMNLFIFLHII